MNTYLQIIVVAAFIFIISFFLIPVKIKAQGSYFVVQGKVIDKNTKAPLVAASVFAQNTTFGVATDSNGNFRLRLPEGGYSLVTTFTGYETESMRINASSNNDSVLFELNPEAKSLEEVTISISNEVPDGWQKYGTFFLDNFIGQTTFSQQCVIKNPKALHFYFFKKRNTLKVKATEPIIVDNFSLGYTLKFAIDSFTNDYNSNTNLFIGYPLFEEMTGTPEQQQTWNRNRQTAYRGSLLHFMRSFYRKKLQEDGFEIRFLTGENEKDSVPAFQNVYDAFQYRMIDSTHTVAFSPSPNRVEVIYTKAGIEKRYLQFDPKAKINFQKSTLLFPADETFYIESNGYFYDQEDLMTKGYMGYRRVGDMLPYDYDLQSGQENTATSDL